MPSPFPPKSFTFSNFHPQTRKHHSSKLPCIVKSVLDLSFRGQLSQAIASLELLSRKGIRLPSQTLAYLIQQCAKTKSLKCGKLVHLHLKLTGLKRPNAFLANNLINMYAECGDYGSAYKVFDEMSNKNLYSWNNMLSGYAKLGKIKPARKLFDRMPEKDYVSWNIMVIAYAQCGFCSEALRYYKELKKLGIGYNEYSFAGLLNVCVKSKELELTRQAHGQVLIVGFLSNLVISSSILDAYVKCNEMANARQLFDEMNVRDVLAWTTMVAGYAQRGEMEAANDLFELMRKKNSVAWTALISGYARHGLGHKALELFAKMMMLHIKPDQFTFSSCLCACASIASLNHGKQIHGYLVRTNFKPNVIVVSSLIDMYSKCGSLRVGRLVFDLMGNKRDVVLWNTMISALAQHGYGEEAIQMFNYMVELGLKPDVITLVVILHACSYSGLVKEGLQLFQSMTHFYCIVPNQEHYACLIDLLGRAGHFDKLMNELEKMPFEPNERILNSLVGVCRIHGHIELGRKAVERLIQLEPQSSAPYVLLSSIYAALRRWELVEKVRQLMDERQVKKERAISWIEIENKVHSFTVSDRLHPRKEVIYLALEQLVGHIEEEVASLDNERNAHMKQSKSSSC